MPEQSETLITFQCPRPTVRDKVDGSVDAIFNLGEDYQMAATQLFALPKQNITLIVTITISDQ